MAHRIKVWGSDVNTVMLACDDPNCTWTYRMDSGEYLADGVKHAANHTLAELRRKRDAQDAKVYGAGPKD